MRSYYLFFVLLLVFACSRSKKDNISFLKGEVMALHDDVMPKMGELYKTQKQLLTMADSMASDSLMAAKYRELAATIELANEYMMDWMRNYKPEFKGTDDEVITYLKAQKESISKVKTDVLESLEAGKKVLNK